jgi:hypothetical protein
MKLHWVKDHEEQYSADSGDRTYIVGVFNVGAYDGDPTLTMYDDRYRSTCWSLTTGWATSLVALSGCSTTSPAHYWRRRMRRTSEVTTHANTQTSVIARDDTDEGWTETTPPRSPAATARPTRTGPAYIADVIGKEMGQLPVADRRQIVGLLAGEGMSNRAIADAVGVNEITVRRDKEQVRHDVALNRSTPITGRPHRRSWPRRTAGPTPPRSPAATTRPTPRHPARSRDARAPNAVPSRCVRR